jgi:predicted naringenin-chalcone synthase
VDFLVHTGGPRILREIAAVLKVKGTNLKASLNVMTANGNL